MDKKSKILLILFVIILVISVSYTFYKTVILQDFEVVNTKELEESSVGWGDTILDEISFEEDLTMPTIEDQNTEEMLIEEEI